MKNNKYKKKRISKPKKKTSTKKGSEHTEKSINIKTVCLV